MTNFADNNNNNEIISEEEMAFIANMGVTSIPAVPEEEPVTRVDLKNPRVQLNAVRIVIRGNSEYGKIIHTRCCLGDIESNKVPANYRPEPIMNDYIIPGSANANACAIAIELIKHEVYKLNTKGLIALYVPFDTAIKLRMALSAFNNGQDYVTTFTRNFTVKHPDYVNKVNEFVQMLYEISRMGVFIDINTLNDTFEYELNEESSRKEELGTLLNEGAKVTLINGVATLPSGDTIRTRYDNLNGTYAITKRTMKKKETYIDENTLVEEQRDVRVDVYALEKNFSNPKDTKVPTRAMMINTLLYSCYLIIEKAMKEFIVVSDLTNGSIIEELKDNNN